MGSKKRFPYILTAEDIVDTEIEVLKGRVVGFALNYRAHVRDAWHEVLRYDTRHGALHVHRFWLDKASRVERIVHTTRPIRDYAAWFMRLKKDLDDNWKSYRQAYERRDTDGA